MRALLVFAFLFTACANPLVPDAGTSAGGGQAGGHGGGSGGGGGRAGGAGGTGGGVAPTTCRPPTTTPPPVGLPCNADNIPCGGCCAGATCMPFHEQTSAVCGRGGAECAPCNGACAAGVCGGGTGGAGGAGDAGCAVPFDPDPIVEPTTTPPPVSGGTLAVVGSEIVIGDPDRDRIYLVDAADSVRTIALTAGDEPGRVTAGPPGRAFVALRRASAVAEIDLVSATLVARHPVCPSPRGLAWSEAKARLSVACATGDLVELTFAGAAPTRVTSQPAEDLRDVFVVDGGLILSTFREARLLRRLDTGVIETVPSPAPLSDHGHAFTPRVMWRALADPSGGGVLTAHQRAQSSLLEIDRSPCGDAIDGGGSGSGYGTGAGGGPPGNAPPGTPMAPIHSVISYFNGTDLVGSTVLNGVALPVDVAMSPQGAVVVASPSRGVFFIPGLIGPSGFQVRMTGVGFTAVGFVGDTMVAFQRDPARLFVWASDGSFRTVTLASTPVTSTGHALFHSMRQSTPMTVACASCHPEGGEDGHVWNIPEGLRRTQSLRGGLTGTEPFHWGGDQASMGSLMSDIFVRRMGGKTLSPERNAALLKWIDGMPKLAPPVRDPAAVARGLALFSSIPLQCSTCHAGPLGTDNCNVAVGTGASLQVPRLVDLAYRAPYFHDGRVPTLKARFTPVGGGDMHGKVTHLTPAQIDDLVTYLESR